MRASGDEHLEGHGQRLRLDLTAVALRRGGTTPGPAPPTDATAILDFFEAGSVAMDGSRVTVYDRTGTCDALSDVAVSRAGLERHPAGPSNSDR